MVGLVDVLVLGMMLGVVLVLGMVIVVVLVPVPELVVLVMMRVRMSVLMKGAVVTVIAWVEGGHPYVPKVLYSEGPMFRAFQEKLGI